jgi:hypothetical protein
MSRTDLIGDFRLDLEDPDEHGMRHGIAKMPCRLPYRVKAGERKEENDIIILVDGYDEHFFARHWVDVAPAVKRALEG